MTTYYVATTGLDTNPGTLGSPFLTVNHGVSVLTPGDTLFIRGGTYIEALNDNIPSGTSFSAAVTVAAYPGETAILRPASGTRVLYFANAGGVKKYIIIDGLVLDAVNCVTPPGSGEGVKITSGANHIRIIRCEIKNAVNQGVLITDDANASRNNEILSNTIHDVGTTSLHHGVYNSTQNNTIDGNIIYNCTGHGVHSFGDNPSGAVIRNNLIHDCTQVGIGLLSNNNQQAYNNVVYGCGTGINVGINSAFVGNNTLDGCGNGLVLGSNTDGTFVNNICTNGTYGIQASGSGGTLQNNLAVGNSTDFFQNSGSYTTGGNLFGAPYTPGYVNRPAHDFHLAAGSSAIGAAQARSEYTTDKDGSAHWSRWDMGAYQTALVPAGFAGSTVFGG